MTKKVGSDESVKQRWESIKFVKECNLIEFFYDIDKYQWINDTIPLEFDFFTINDDILKYLGAHLELSKSNEKRNKSYILNEYAYFGQEINFNEFFYVQPLDGDDNDIQGLEESPSLLQKKRSLHF